MPLTPARFRSPWNPFQNVGNSQPIASNPGGRLSPADVADSFGGGAAGAADFSYGAPLVSPAASGPDSSAVSAAAGAAAIATASGVPVGGSIVAPVSAGIVLPGPLRRDGVATPQLEQAIRAHEYGWNQSSETMFRRFDYSRRVVNRMKRRRRQWIPAAMPASGIRINPSGTMQITIATAAGSYAILAYRVPPGYAGFLNYASNEYAGAAFTEASGALVWYIEVQQWFYQGYGNIPFTLGSRQASLWNIAGGLPIRSNQYIVYGVTYTPGAGLTAGGYVICNLQGWIAPMKDMWGDDTREVSDGIRERR
jgi:hypothetical protein